MHALNRITGLFNFIASRFYLVNK